MFINAYRGHQRQVNLFGQYTLFRYVVLCVSHQTNNFQHLSFIYFVHTRLRRPPILILSPFSATVTVLTLNAPITTKVVCFSRLPKYLRSLYGIQCGSRSDCSYRSSLFSVHAVCFYTYFDDNVRQLFAADDFSRRHFQMHFFLGAIRVNS